MPQQSAHLRQRLTVVMQFVANDRRNERELTSPHRTAAQTWRNIQSARVIAECNNHSGSNE